MTVNQKPDSLLFSWLTIAAVVLLAGPAQAVDYVKCEAMKNAMERISNGIFYHAISLRSKESVDQASRRCNSGADRETYVSCLQSEAKKYQLQNPSKYDQIINSEGEKLRRIKRDFAIAGCNY
jgi:hypothetical protein